MLGRLDSEPPVSQADVHLVPRGFVAVIAGWFTAEIGRQPWVVYRLLRTREAVTPSLSTADVAISLFLYVLVYGVVYAFGVWYLYRLIGGGFRRWRQTGDRRLLPPSPCSGAAVIVFLCCSSMSSSTASIWASEFCSGRRATKPYEAG